MKCFSYIYHGYEALAWTSWSEREGVRRKVHENVLYRNFQEGYAQETNQESIWIVRCIWANHDVPKLDTASTENFPKPHGIRVDGRAQTVCSL